MLNTVSITGRLVETPELRRTTNSDIPVTSFRIACSRDYVGEGDTREADFVDVDAWRQTAEFACKHFAKGRLITVVGRLKNKPWTDKYDQKRTDTVIEAQQLYFGDSKPKGETAPAGNVDPFASSDAPPPAPETPDTQETPINPFEE